MPYPTRHSNHLSWCAKLFLTINNNANLALLYMENLVLIEMNMLKRDIAIRLNNPFHRVCFFVVRKTPKSLFGYRIRKRLVQINSHTCNFPELENLAF